VPAKKKMMSILPKVFIYVVLVYQIDWIVAATMLVAGDCEGNKCRAIR
jgi:hypothetical protein